MIGIVRIGRTVEVIMFRNKFVFSSRLVATPSFLSGYARALDVAGTFDAYNNSSSETDADMKAIENDWRVVGNQLREAIASK